MRLDKKGYALPTILLISMIIIIITMSIVARVRQKITVARDLKSRSSAYLKSYSAMNRVIYNILTSKFTPSGILITPGDKSEIIWNLYGDPIELENDVVIKLRDEAGMVSPITNPKKIRALIKYASKDSGKIDSFMDALLDWQDVDNLKRLNGAESYDYLAAGYQYTPRNFYIQLPEEIMLLKGLDQTIFEEIKDDIVYWGSGTMNFLTASKKTLRSLLKNDSLVDSIIEIRKKGELTGKTFRNLTNIPITERDILYPSDWIKVEITAKTENAKDTIEAVIVKSEMKGKPFMVVMWKR